MAEYKNFGVQLVDPARIRIDPPISDDWQETQHGTSRALLEDTVSNVSDVNSKIQDGYGKGDFERLSESSDAHDAAVAKSYEMFYGDHPVKVTREGNSFVTDGGRHRVQIAQKNHLEKLAVEVHAPPNDPEFAEKPFDAARSPDREQGRENNPKMSAERYSPPEAESFHADKPDSPETPELNKSRGEVGQPHRDGLPPDQKDLYDREIAGAAGQNSYDSMSGDEEPRRETSGRCDSMDGAKEIPKSAEREDADLSDSLSARG